MRCKDLTCVSKEMAEKVFFFIKKKVFFVSQNYLPETKKSKEEMIKGKERKKKKRVSVYKELTSTTFRNTSS